MTLERDPLTIQLARAFAECVLGQFDQQTLSEVVRRNDAAGYASSCATHDFCDANMLMLQAMQECDIVFDPSNEAQARLTDAAWSLAKAANFVPEDILSARPAEQASSLR